MAHKKGARDHHQRIEFVLHKQSDKALIDYLTEIKRSGILSDFLRDLIGRSMKGDVNAQTDIHLLTQNERMQEEIADLKATQASVIEEMQAMRSDMQHSGVSQEAFDQLAHTVDQLALKVETLQLTGGSLQDGDDLTTPLAVADDPRQARMSAKLKAIRFDGLTH